MVSLDYANEIEENFYDIDLVSSILDNTFEFYFSEYDHNNPNEDADIYEDLYEYMKLKIHNMYENDDVLFDVYDNIFCIIEYLDNMTLKYFERPLTVNEISSVDKIIDLMIWYIFKEFMKSHNYSQQQIV